MKKKSIIIIVVLSIISSGIYIAISIYNKPHIDVAKTTPDISIPSQKLLEDFESDENTANSKYLDKIIQVSGQIKELDASNGNAVIELNDGLSISSVMCHMSPKNNKDCLSLKKGQNITVKGICTGYLLDVILIDCSIIS